jgi:hypothetical protein
MIQFLLINPKSAICIPQSKKPAPQTPCYHQRYCQLPQCITYMTSIENSRAMEE